MPNFLDDVRKASVSRYMAQKDHEVLAKLREAMDREASAAAIAESGVNDQDLVQSLVELGIELDTLPVLHLVPLFQVAWSDGEVQAEELDLLRAAANEAGVKAGSKAHQIFEDMVAKPPAQELYDASLKYIHMVLSTMADAEAETKRNDLTALAGSVAQASGKLLGFFGSGVQSEEQTVLKTIAARLQDRA